MLMGICCSMFFEPKCKKCGCPYHYYTSDEHASRQSCRGHNDDNNIEFSYHEWKSIF